MVNVPLGLSFWENSNSNGLVLAEYLTPNSDTFSESISKTNASITTCFACLSILFFIRSRTLNKDSISLGLYATINRCSGSFVVVYTRDTPPISTLILSPDFEASLSISNKVIFSVSGITIITGKSLGFVEIPFLIY